jgi:hypothetical protein
MVTLYVAFSALVGMYCTRIVQLPPGLTTAPFTQVPPGWIEKVPAPVPLTLVNEGAAVSVSGPAVVPVAVLLTVMVPAFALVPPPFMAGVGPENKTVAPDTVNVTVLLVPLGVVVTLTVLVPSAAPAVIVKFAVTELSFTTVTPLTVTPAPDTVTAVAPVKPVPVRVTGTTVPRAPEVGAIEVRAGPSNVNVTPPLVPPGVVTETVLVAGVREAFAAIVKVAVI